jgi:hypothetical protein
MAREQVEHVALLIKNTGTCSALCHKIIPTSLRGIISSPSSPAFAPGIHVFAAPEDADGWDKPGHDELSRCSS